MFRATMKVLAIWSVLFFVSAFMLREIALLLNEPSDVLVAVGCAGAAVVGGVWIWFFYWLLRKAAKEVQRGQVRGKAGRAGRSGGGGRVPADDVRDHKDRPGVRGNPGEHGGVEPGR